MLRRNRFRAKLDLRNLTILSWNEYLTELFCAFCFDIAEKNRLFGGSWKKTTPGELCWFIYQLKKCPIFILENCEFVPKGSFHNNSFFHKQLITTIYFFVLRRRRQINKMIVFVIFRFASVLGKKYIYELPRQQLWATQWCSPSIIKVFWFSSRSNWPVPFLNIHFKLLVTSCGGIESVFFSLSRARAPPDK